ncbi:MAG TPA: serine/threonine-protein kinase, partial [Kofleriaceae bacterium]|nr:serine/threonine-protein kinase [Kofleriaceae bacterium]
MSPDERARRGLTPPDQLSSDAAAMEREALAPTNAAPLVPANGGEALPLEESSRYELEGVHARGGLGRVVRAHDRLLRRTVAIKELLQRTPSAQARFMREALITARLQHPGIVPVHEAGRWASGDPYYSMKLVSGRTLKELIQARKAPDERLALLPHVLAVAEAIAYAHSQDVIHRDIKPANVVVGDFGETVVVDWGLAKDLASSTEPDRDCDEVAEPHDSGTGPAATAVGHIMGTPSYMAPEQARGDTIDARADVYSLGAMLYELLAGEPPHTGDSADKILLSALAASPVPIELRQPGAPPDLVAIVHKAMARRPDDRYPSAIELAEDVRRFQTGQLVTARRYSTRTLIRRWIGRHRGVVAMAAVAAVALAVTGAVAFQRVVAQRNLAQDRRAAAQKAEQTALERQNELIFLQAQSWLTRDPTAALAWLKLYPSHGNLAEPVGAMVDEALDLGVARHILRQTTWPQLVAFTGDGGLIGLLKSGEVTRYDVETGAGRLLGRQGENVRSAAMSPDGKLLAVGGLSGSIQLFSADGAHPPRRLPNQSDTVNALIFSADGRRLLSVSAEREVRLWDVARGEPVLSLDREQVTTAELSGDGETVFLALASGAIDRITVATGARRKVAELDRRAYGLALSPDGKLLAAEWGEWTLGSMALIDLKTGEVEPLDMPAGKGTWGFSPNGRYLASASNDGTVHVHELASETDTVLRGHEDAIYHMVFSGDEAKLLTASDDATARLWDLKTGSVSILRGHEDDVFTAALSADGKTAVTASFDASIRLWQLDSSEEVSQVVGHMGKVLQGSKPLLTEDGGILLAQTGDDEGLYWNLATGERLRRSLERDG